MFHLTSLRLAVVCLGLLVMLPATRGVAQDLSPPRMELNENEQKFANLLTGATLAGSFTIDLQAEPLPKMDSYRIQSLAKVAEDKWIVNANMSYKDLNVPVPIPVEVRWAGDTPVLQLTGLAIPLVGEDFTARILFFGDRYAGTWQHGRFGGHLWGRVQRTPPNQPSPTGAESAAPQAPSGKPSGAP